ncbi:MAG: ion channel [Ginsengibacter sp.]|jgi:inward rectifier potassium channel
MAFFRNRKVQMDTPSEINTGYGSNSKNYGGRFVNKNGKPNVEKKGIGYFEKLSWYHTLLIMPRYQFILMIVTFYISINLVFGFIYFFMGPEDIMGINSPNHLHNFAESFFFSCQTFTTVGYGRISPVSFFASAISSLEALLGLLTLAVITGLLYGRFSRPKAYIRFSNDALLSPFRGGEAIMLRLAPYKNTLLTEVEAKVTLGLVLDEDGNKINKFYSLPLEYNSVNSLTLSWTIVHPINKESPFYNFSHEDYRNIKGEIIVFIKAFEETFSNTVVARTSYTLDEIIVGASFSTMFHKANSGDKTILHLDQLSAHKKSTLPKRDNVN